MGKKALPLVMDISSNQNGIMRMQIDGRNQNGKDKQYAFETLFIFNHETFNNYFDKSDCVFAKLR